MAKEALALPHAETMEACTLTRGGKNEAMFMVGGVHCAGCIAKLEHTLTQVPGVIDTRLNFTTKRLKLTWKGTPSTALEAITAAHKAGYTLQPYNPETLKSTEKSTEDFLLRCLAVAGFANMNVMLLSVSLWAGALEDPATRSLMEWLSAFIVLPAIAYAGQPYFRAAWQALSHRRTSMEVPISLALILTTGLSLADTIMQSGDTFFESATMLLFFLLTGRYLEARVRGTSRNAAEHLLTLQHTLVAIVEKNGEITLTHAENVEKNTLILWRKGERLGVDGVITEGTSEADTSVLTGESLPRSIQKGSLVQAGMVNVGETLTVKATATGQNTVLAEIARLVENATTAKNSYTRLADRISRYYAPVVHSLALLTFLGSMAWGVSTHESILRAAAVLLVTCPCALALAVPTVQVAVISNLLKKGIILKGGEALEKLASITHVVLDKTGTLTTGTLTLVSGGTKLQRALAARLAASSNHPLSAAISAAIPGAKPFKNAKEIPGKGVEAKEDNITYRLGSSAFCHANTAIFKKQKLTPGQTLLWLQEGTQIPTPFILSDELRPTAVPMVKELTTMGIPSQMLSGDTTATAQSIARQIGLTEAKGECTPQQKQAILKSHQQNGHHVLMVGDGINDAPSLALAEVGISFGSATNLAQLSADIILQQQNLTLIPTLIHTARRAKNTTILNFVLSFAYNILTIPLAMVGAISPLWAAVAMSASSITVVSSSLFFTRSH